jgi:putative transposase
MPRANRHFLPGHVWHITHLCSSQFQSFQWFNRCAVPNVQSRSAVQRFKVKICLTFARDRRRYLRWVFEAKKRFGLFGAQITW